MGTEIERKFLVEGDLWRHDVTHAVELRQGYLRAEDATVRVRIAGPDAFLTIKGRTVGTTRSEWEWPIPAADAAELIEAFCGTRTIHKTRHHVVVGEHEWVIDLFHGRHAGLLLAEIELERENEPFVMPSWAGAEVSHDPHYFNSALAGA